MYSSSQNLNLVRHVMKNYLILPSANLKWFITLLNLGKIGTNNRREIIYVMTN